MFAEGVRLFLSILATLWSGFARVSAVTRIVAGRFGEPGRRTGRPRTAKPVDASNAAGLERGRRNVACRTQRLCRIPQSCRKSRRSSYRWPDQPIAQPAFRKTARWSRATATLRSPTSLCPTQRRRRPQRQRWAIRNTDFQKNPVVFGQAAMFGSA